MKKLIPIIFIALASYLLYLFYTTNNNKVETKQIIDTIYITQTFRDTIPQLIYQKKTKTIIDTLYNIDSVLIPIYLPLERHKYANEIITNKQDTVAYTASISGYKVSLDSISIAIKYKQYNTTTTNIIKVKQKNNWYITPIVGVGYGIINNKVDVYVGVGLGYKF